MKDTRVHERNRHEFSHTDVDRVALGCPPRRYFCNSPNWLATQIHSLLCLTQVSVNRP